MDPYPSISPRHTSFLGSSNELTNSKACRRKKWSEYGCIYLCACPSRSCCFLFSLSQASTKVCFEVSLLDLELSMLRTHETRQERSLLPTKKHTRQHDHKGGCAVQSSSQSQPVPKFPAALRRVESGDHRQQGPGIPTPLTQSSVVQTFTLDGPSNQGLFSMQVTVGPLGTSRPEAIRELSNPGDGAVVPPIPVAVRDDSCMWFQEVVHCFH